MEIWKDIIGYENLYQVSTLGNFRSLLKNKDNPHPLRIAKSKNGYALVKLYKNKVGKTLLCHRLVATAFLNDIGECPFCKNILEINHKDHNKFNNNANNLEYISRRGNMTYNKENMTKRKGWNFK